MRKTSSAPATGQLALLDLPPAPAASGRADARRRVDGSRRALQAATNARQCEELLAALDRVSAAGRAAGRDASNDGGTLASPRGRHGSAIERGPFAASAVADEEEVAQRLADLYAACERAADAAIPSVPRRASR